MCKIRYHLWRLLILLTRKLNITLVVEKKCGLKNLNLNLLVSTPESSDIQSLNPEKLFLGPDFLFDAYTLLDCPLIKSPHYELVDAISKNEEVKKTEYYRRHISGKLDWRYLMKPGITSHFFTKYYEVRAEIEKGEYKPIKVYVVDNKYYIYDGKHRAAMCCLMNVKVKCEVVDASVALGGVFSYMFRLAETNKKMTKHKVFFDSLCRK